MSLVYLDQHSQRQTLGKSGTWRQVRAKSLSLWCRLQTCQVFVHLYTDIGVPKTRVKAIGIVWKSVIKKQGTDNGFNGKGINFWKGTPNWGIYGWGVFDLNGWGKIGKGKLQRNRRWNFQQKQAAEREKRTRSGKQQVNAVLTVC